MERRRSQRFVRANDSYTIQGGQANTIEERGVLPRAIDLVFNSISGLESNANVGDIL